MRQSGRISTDSIKLGSLFFFLNLVDALLTAFLLSLGAPELNPIYSSLGNIYVFAATKLVLVCLVLLGLTTFKQAHLLKWLNAGMGLIVAWNIVAAATWLA